MNRRGVTEYPLAEAGMLVLMSFLVIIVIGFVYQLAAGQLGTSKDETRASIKGLHEQLQELVGGDLVALQQVPVFLGTGRTLVAFGRNTFEVEDKCTQERIPKPDQCGAQSCLCVYEGMEEPECYLTPRVFNYYGIEYFKGRYETLVRSLNQGTSMQELYDYSIRDTINTLRGIPQEEAVSVETVPARVYHNALGGPVAYPSTLRKGVLPSLLSHAVIHGSCLSQIRLGLHTSPHHPLDLHPIYLEKHEDSLGQVHILITPASPYTEERYERLTGGKSFVAYLRRLQEESQRIICPPGEQGVGCFNPDVTARTYEALKRFYPGKSVKALLLYELASRLRSTHPATAKDMYDDYSAWYPNGEHVMEALYYQIVLTYDPRQLNPGVSIPANQRETLRAAVQEADHLIAYVDEHEDATTSAYSNRFMPYKAHTHLLRGFYHLALENYEAAHKDLETYNRLSDEREEDYPPIIADIHQDLASPQRALAYAKERAPSQDPPPNTR